MLSASVRSGGRSAGSEGEGPFIQAIVLNHEILIQSVHKKAQCGGDTGPDPFNGATMRGGIVTQVGSKLKNQDDCVKSILKISSDIALFRTMRSNPYFFAMPMVPPWAGS
jgi:hypothetical protein